MTCSFFFSAILACEASAYPRLRENENIQLKYKMGNKEKPLHTTRGPALHYSPADCSDTSSELLPVSSSSSSSSPSSSDPSLLDSSSSSSEPDPDSAEE